MMLLKSKITVKIFCDATLASKEELVAYILSDACIESDCINSNKSIDEVRDIKDTLSQYPFSAISWVYFDHEQDKNQKFIRQVLESFDRKAMDLLA